MTLQQFWQQCQQHLQNTLAPAQYQQWIAPLVTLESEDGNWLICAPNMFILNMLRHQYAPQIRQLQQQWQPEGGPALLFQQNQPNHQTTLIATPVSANLTHTHNESNKPTVSDKKQSAPSRSISAVERINQRIEKNRNNNDKPVSDKPNPITIETPKTESNKPANSKPNADTLKPEHTFATLVEGKGNRLALAAGQAIAEAPGKARYNPFFLYGSTGMGKTHLVQAIGNLMQQLHPKAKISYMHANQYTSNMMAAFRNKNYETFKQYYKQFDLLIIDDIQFIKGKERTMEEFFYLYNHFHEHKKQIILTCDVLPSQIEELDDRLKSRLSWGLTLELEPPELEMRVEILQKKATLAGCTLTEEAAFFIAKHIRSNVRELEGAFNRVQARSEFTGRPIDIELATEALQDLISNNHKPITAELIITTVAQYYGIKENDLIGKKRAQAILHPRQIAMNLCKDLTDLSLAAIGSYFSKRDHSTVINAVEKAQKLRENQAEIEADYKKLQTLIKN